jgi:hypothetical protein
VQLLSDLLRHVAVQPLPQKRNYSVDLFPTSPSSQPDREGSSQSINIPPNLPALPTPSPTHFSSPRDALNRGPSNSTLSSCQSIFSQAEYRSQSETPRSSIDSFPLTMLTGVGLLPCHPLSPAQSVRSRRESYEQSLSSMDAVPLSGKAKLYGTLLDLLHNSSRTDSLVLAGTDRNRFQSIFRLPA